MVANSFDLNFYDVEVSKEYILDSNLSASSLTPDVALFDCGHSAAGVSTGRLSATRSLSACSVREAKARRPQPGSGAAAAAPGGSGPQRPAASKAQ